MSPVRRSPQRGRADDPTDPCAGGTTAPSARRRERLQRLVDRHHKRIEPERRINERSERPVGWRVKAGLTEHDQRGVGVQLERRAPLDRVCPVGCIAMRRAPIRSPGRSTIVRYGPTRASLTASGATSSSLLQNIASPPSVPCTSSPQSGAHRRTPAAPLPAHSWRARPAPRRSRTGRRPPRRVLRCRGVGSSARHRTERVIMGCAGAARRPDRSPLRRCGRRSDE